MYRLTNNLSLTPKVSASYASNSPATAYLTSYMRLPDLIDACYLRLEQIRYTLTPGTLPGKPAKFLRR